jgi:hypothetical protein
MNFSLILIDIIKIIDLSTVQHPVNFLLTLLVNSVIFETPQKIYTFLNYFPQLLPTQRAYSNKLCQKIVSVVFINQPKIQFFYTLI